MSALQRNISGTNIYNISFINILPLTLRVSVLVSFSMLQPSDPHQNWCQILQKACDIPLNCLWQSEIFLQQ